MDPTQSIQTTIVRTNPDPKAPHGGLAGQPPPQFHGDRTKSKRFLQKFELWALTNQDHEQMQVPWKWAALFLTFLNGEAVDDWVQQQTE